MNQFFMTPEQTAYLTPLWNGERLDDGRPKVSDAVLDRMRNLTLEEMWSCAWSKSWDFQTETRLSHTHSTEKPLVGRALTITCVPWRGDLDEVCRAEAKAFFNVSGDFRSNDYNKNAVGRLQKNDVMVIDFFDKVKYGTFFGGNLSTAVANRTGCGAVVWGGIRDVDQVIKIPNLQIFYRGSDPTPIRDYVMTGYNRPAKIGEAVCMPGDIVFGSAGGVVFVPAHMAEEAVDAAEKSHVIDMFGFIRLKERKYTPAAIDALPWTPEMWADFLAWFKADSEAQKYHYLDWGSDNHKPNG
jgi:regulator of RNase E activity RraA